MLLTVDVGNTNIVLGLYSGRGDDAKLVGDWRMRTDARMTADELALTMRETGRLARRLCHRDQRALHGVGGVE